MATKILKYSSYLLFATFVIVAYSTMELIDLPKSECEAIGARIINNGNGKTICRYVLNR